MLAQVKANLQKAHTTMKLYYDKCHRDLSFALGNYIWLHLQLYRQLSLTSVHRHKLAPKYYGPFQVLTSIGSVAYHLQLPPDANLHDIFHDSLLRPFCGDSPLLHTSLPPHHEGCTLPCPAKVLQACHAQDSWELLIQWSNAELLPASWEPLEQFQTLYPTFELTDKLFLQEGVMLSTS
ncbi:uncharacterized protein [Aristolochia californica]|uniref:uncharacterized protein n=1 Tax=Aristolochia californica TaxID=171875 RepID=UPI0035D9E533